jgi:hypothetical protein
MVYRHTDGAITVINPANIVTDRQQDQWIDCYPPLMALKSESL